MPYAEKESTTQAAEVKEHDNIQLIDLFGLPTTYDMGGIVDQAWARLPSDTGRKQPYPGGVVIGALAGCRIGGSALSAARLFGFGDTWEQIRASYEAMTNGTVVLSSRPPSIDWLENVKAKVLRTKGLLDALHVGFMRCAVGQALAHGNLSRGATPTWLTNDEAHKIYGDGTVFEMYSHVKTITHPLTGAVEVVGGDAKDPARARIQRFETDTSQDDKARTRGVNHVSVHTWTPEGRVVLGLDYALGAELWPALDLVDAVVALAGDGVHTLVWDRVITGWPVDYLMGQHRIATVNKAVAASTKKAETDD